MKLSRIFKVIRFLNRKHTLKVMSVILLLGIFFILPAFAQDATKNDTSTLADIQEALGKLIGLFSRIRIFLAVLAGKLMTNEFVYGSFMHLDIYLRKVRNIMKNFANFALVFMILLGVVKYIVNSSKAEHPKNIVVKALLAGILIQASWFIVGACIDLSTIATQAVAAFPAKFIGSDQLAVTMTKEAQKVYSHQYYYTTRNGKTTSEIRELSDPGSCNVDITEDFMPNYDSVSGPLMYIGFSALKIQQYMDAESIASAKKPGALIINFLLKVIILGFFVFVLALLCIANLIRILFLRLLVLGSPILILVGLFDKDKKISGGEGITKFLNVGTFIDLIFKPVIFVAFLGLTLIFVSSMQSIMIGPKTIQSLNGITMTFTGGKSTLDVEGLSTFSVNEDIFKDIGGSGEAKNIFADLIIFFMTIFLLRFLLKQSVTNGKGPIGSAMGKVIPLMERLMGSLPIVPTAAGNVGVAHFKDFGDKQMKKVAQKMGFDINAGKISLDEGGREYLENKRYPGQWQPWHEDQLRDTTTGEEFFNKSKEIGEKLYGGLSLNSAWGSILTEKLKTSELAVGSEKLSRWNENDTIDTYLQKTSSGSTIKTNGQALQAIMEAKGFTTFTSDKKIRKPGEKLTVNDIFGGSEFK